MIVRCVKSQSEICTKHSLKHSSFLHAFIRCFQLEKVRAAYHKSCQKEQTALDREKQGNEDAEMSPEKKQKLADAREKATGEKLKVSREVNTHTVQGFTSNPTLI